MRTLLAAAVVLVVGGMSLAAGRPGMVRTNDGVIFEGAVEESTESVTVDVHGIKSTVARGNIASITYGDFEERWKESYGKLAATDAGGRLAAGRQAFDQGRYDLAETALREAIALEPNNADAAELLKLTINQRRMEREKPAQTRPPEAAKPTELNGQLKAPGTWATLTPLQINRIKQLELREADASTIRFGFDNNVRKTFYESNPKLNATYHSYADFLQESPFNQATQIIKNGGDAAKDVRVVNDPASVVMFRRDVLPLVLQGCATASCHGGNNMATDKFALITPATDAAAIYTDYYVLNGTKLRRTTKTNASGADKAPPDLAPMFDRSHPEESAILQYGLPPGMAETKHPQVRGYNGIFRSRDDARYQAVLQFVTSLSPIAPDYGITFKMERNGLPAVRNPATLPAGAP